MRADARAGGRRGQIFELRAVADDDIFLDHAGRADIGVGADLDRADDQLIADDARIGELQLRAERRAGADRDEIDRAGVEFADERVVADLRAERRADRGA